MAQNPSSTRRRSHIWLMLAIPLFLLGGITWLWQKGFNMEQVLLKIQSLVVSIHSAPQAENMVPIPRGKYQQGDVEELGEARRNPVREVTIQPFAMGKYEVTFEEYDRFAIATNRKLPKDQGWGRGQRPVISVSWEDAKAYAAWMSGETGKRYRLPTESEWEYAARSGHKQEAWAGTSDESQLGEYAVYAGNSGKRTAEVGEDKGRKPNNFGLYDMSGNVDEWVEDCVHGNYNSAPGDGSAWLKTNGGDCLLRVFRGGSWYSEPETLRTSNRLWYSTFTHLRVLGFRLAQDLD